MRTSEGYTDALFHETQVECDRTVLSDADSLGQLCQADMPGLTSSDSAAICLSLVQTLGTVGTAPVRGSYFAEENCDSNKVGRGAMIDGKIGLALCKFLTSFQVTKYR